MSYICYPIYILTSWQLATLLLTPLLVFSLVAQVYYTESHSVPISLSLTVMTRITAITVQTVYGTVLFICVYMPTDYSDAESYEIETCTKITAIYEDSDAVHLIIAGDFNCHISSPFYDIFTELTVDCNVACTDLTKLTDTFTYCSDDALKCSWIDHMLCSPIIDKLVSSCYVQYDFFSSDHKPLTTVFTDLFSTIVPSAALSINDAIVSTDWSQADDVCISQYRYELDIALRNIDIPVPLCTHGMIHNSESIIYTCIDSYCDAIISCIQNACVQTITV